MFGPKIHRFIFLLAICCLGGNLALGEVPTSIPEIVLGSNWFLEGNYKHKWRLLAGNKIFWVLISLFFLHVIGLIYTHDMKYAGDDILVKAPLLILPFFFFSAQPLSKRELRILFYVYLAGVLSSSFWCLGYFSNHPDIDPRDASRFISHIRYGLIINMAICIAAWLMREQEKLTGRIIFGSIAVYLLFFMFALSMVTGLMMFSILLTISLCINILSRSVPVKVGSFAVLITLFSLLFITVRSEWKAFSYVERSPANTDLKISASGRPYEKIENKGHTENGFYTAINIQHVELIKQWEIRTKSSIYNYDGQGNTLISTAARYMASKGLTKDSAGFSKLSDEDIENIKKGITNYKYANASALRTRLKQFFWEYGDYKSGSNPSGNTMLMRFEFWKAAIYIIKRNIWIGVGTGDARRAFVKAYTRTNTALTHEWRLRSHNQFLAITVTFGVVGLIVFLFVLIYPIIILKKYLHPLYFIFYIIAIVSFLTEDTLESQAGVTFVAYFNSLFLWLACVKKESSDLRNDPRSDIP